MSHPHKAYKTIHVGGTNGKGSVTYKIAKALEAEGFKVGLYTSPHICDVRERIQVQGELIPEDAFQRLLNRILELEPSLGFFDIMTAIAFCYFQEQKVDWAVVEVGLGGRFDATNVIHPEIAAITSIGFDHTELLGNSLEEIAIQKGGIAKPGVPLVTGPTASCFFPNSIKVEKAPFFDLENQSIAKAVLRKLSISESAIEIGVAKRPPCRFEMRKNIILDVAHNPDGFKKLIEALQLHLPEIEKFHFIVAFSKSKDWKTCLDLILPFSSSITALSIDKERMEHASEIQKYHDKISISKSLETSLKPKEWNVICGSFYLMEQILLNKNFLDKFHP